LKLYAKGRDFPGSTSTRALGHSIGMKLGMSDTPELKHLILDKTDNMIMIMNKELNMLMESKEFTKICTLVTMNQM
jgi:hypothetical protein